MKPPLVNGNLEQLLEWVGHNDNARSPFSFLNKQVFSKDTAGGLILGSYSPQNVSYKS